jgi:hypothetical protein
MNGGILTATSDTGAPTVPQGQAKEQVVVLYDPTVRQCLTKHIPGMGDHRVVWTVKLRGTTVSVLGYPQYGAIESPYLLGILIH